MPCPAYPGGIWGVDFEFHPANGREGNLPVVVCMVARNLLTGKTLHYWQDELYQMQQPPFPTGADALFVAYYVSAELGCFLVLGWAFPVNIVDLFVEFRCLTNGLNPAHGYSLLGALLYYQLPNIGSDEKSDMRDLILQGEPYTPQDRTKIINYCASDVVGLDNLFPAMQKQIDFPRALVRGEYMKAVANIEYNGVPVDTEMFNLFATKWDDIKLQLVASIDTEYGVFVGDKFKLPLFEQYLAAQGMSWPRTGTGMLQTDADTFRGMCNTYPKLHDLREIKASLSQMKLFSELQVGDDGRNRCLLSVFKSKTGRNQPSNSKFIFGPAVWLRFLIRPRQGWGLAYVDWSQQEFGIAAELSKDENMKAAYRSGDCYLSFAKQSGAAPPEATKQSHGLLREQFKQTVLATQYGMGVASLALRIGQPEARAHQLLALHRQTYRRFWAWTEEVLNESQLGGMDEGNRPKLWTPFGWQYFTPSKASAEPNTRSLINFPVQATGSDMMRIAAILLTQAGIRVCAPVHDAFLIEAPLDVIDEAAATTQKLMREASNIVLNGFELGSDAKVIRYPDRYVDERGVGMWNKVIGLLGLPDEKV